MSHNFALLCFVLGGSLVFQMAQCHGLARKPLVGDEIREEDLPSIDGRVEWREMTGVAGV